ncbi:glycosyltransferase involved in cell wall biosynthesis [Paenibacillus endophyticus]|uniref:Glycosyltransferase involved in cell wall biosynthesis n=1 Tax=Paenibacillus endophyticus TaxID=1294268 RepID=A0A7W5CC35_9BACL|nr:glycosyltransferase [Paenibacillus endophyticus]MBB3154971.1 glycosyltransferase involved in cell wall biosynthesis [Paenibacillus endophyticus]
MKLAAEGVSMIAATVREPFLQQIFHNYDRQIWTHKELIIIVNDNAISLAPYMQKALDYPNVSVFRVDEGKNLGACLNYGVAQAKFNYIAKLDDDDYYSPYYLTEAMQQFSSSDADIVGKRSCYFYFPHRSKLLFRRTAVRANSRCKKIAGATIMFHRNVFEKVQFPTKVIQGSDVRFIRACLANGFRLYTTSRYNFVAFRRKDPRSHTWKVNDYQLLSSKGAIIIRTTNFNKHIMKPFHIVPSGIASKS